MQITLDMYLEEGEKREKEKKRLERAKIETSLIDPRANINAMVRYAASYTKVPFSQAWKNLYRFANYDMKMNISARKGKGPLINNLNEKEIKSLERIARSWLTRKGIRPEDVLDLK